MATTPRINEPWVDKIGAIVARELSDKYGEDFDYHQAGPYTQSNTPHLDIYFKGPSVTRVGPRFPTDKTDLRCGYAIEASFQKKGDQVERSLTAAFSLWGKDNVRTTFLPRPCRQYLGVFRKKGNPTCDSAPSSIHPCVAMKYPMNSGIASRISCPGNPATPV